MERRLHGNERFRAINNAVADQGLKVVFLLRLSPVFPFILLNYALGLTRVRFVDYLLASVGMLPATVVYVYYGKVLGEVAAIAGGVEIERGPADYAMLATGGAGPVHAWGVARKLGLRRIVCPTAAGVASALGLLVAPARVDRVATVNLALDAMDWQRLEAVYQSLEADGRAVIGRTGLDPASATVHRLADIRYIGQAYELVVDLPDGCYSAASKPALLAAFERQYREHFTRTPPAVPIEFVNLRVRVQATVPGAAATTRTATTAPAEKLKGTRMVFFPESGPNGGEFVATPVYAREGLLSGDRFDGPAVVKERDSTLVVGPGGRAVVTATGNIVVELDGSQP